MKAKLSKEIVLEWSKDHIGARGGISTYTVKFLADSDFGVPGAVIVTNSYDNEFFLESIDIEENVHFACKSWVQPNKLHPQKRVFFINKVTCRGYIYEELK